MLLSTFLLVGADIPHGLIGSDRLLEALIRDHPHWIYHLAFEPAGDGGPQSPPFSPTFLAEDRDWLPRLQGLLGLKRRVHVGVKELVAARNRVVGSTPPAAFPISPDTNCNSWGLALALGLLAAGASCELPPWVAFSAPLGRDLAPDLPLQFTDRLLDKVRICLGGDPRYDLRSLVDPYYHHKAGESIYGPRSRRVISGGVRLLITSSDVQAQEEELRRELGAEFLAIPFDDLCQGDLKELPSWIKEQTGDGLLLAEVPTAWHAARILRLPTPATAAEALAGPAQPACAFWSVPLNKPGAARDDTSYRDYRARKASSRLDEELLNNHSIEGRLGIIVTQAMQTLGCDGGNIRRLGDVPDMVEAVGPSATANLAGLLRSVPAHQGIIGRVLGTGETVQATSRAEFEEAMRYVRPGRKRQRLEDHHQPDACRAYERLLGRIGSCLAVPLLHDGELLGVLCLQRGQEGGFDSIAVHVVERLAERAAVELFALREHERRQRDGQMPEMMLRLSDLLGELPRLPLSEAIDRLGHALADDACKLSKGYRATVRWLDHEGAYLSVIGQTGAWPEDFRGKLFPRCQRLPDQRLAAAYMRALEQNASYLIEDTSKNDVHYQEIHPPAKAHLAILISAGLHPVGVLSVDFDEASRHLCDEARQQRLEQLARIYAGHIHMLHREQLYSRLNERLRDLSELALEDPATKPTALHDWFRTVGHALGANRGTLFLRSRASGEYRAHTTLEEGDGIHDGAYAPGEGRTGWVIEHKEPLRIVDCEDTRWLVQNNIHLTPSRHPDCWDRTKEQLSYLGVPILVGKDVLGVLRFARITPKGAAGAGPKTYFTHLDQQLARAAASHLAPLLHEQQQRRQRRTIERLRNTLFQLRSRRELAEALAEALELVVGQCVCVLRLIDRWDDGRGVAEGLVGQYFGDGKGELWPDVRDQHEGLAGRVWADGKIRVFPHQDLRRADQANTDELPHEAWQDVYRQSVVVPVRAGEEFLGTLGVHRTPRGSLLEADIEFIEQAALLAGQALRSLDEKERLETQKALLWALVNYYHERASRGRASQQFLLWELSNALRQGCGVPERDCRVHTWQYDDQDNCYHLLGESGRAIPLARIEGSLRPAVLVVSRPESDLRLEVLLENLPEADRSFCQAGQRAAIRFPGARAHQPFPPTIFLLAARPPHRLSHTRVDRLREMLLSVTMYYPIGEP